jgi:hypothetical protein
MDAFFKTAGSDAFVRNADAIITWQRPELQRDGLAVSL